MKRFWVPWFIIFTTLLGCGGSGSTSSQEQIVKISTILVPLYSYPADANYGEHHQRLAQLNGLIRANPKDCFLVYGVRDTAQARELLSYLTSRGASCAYAVDEDPPLWFELSPYMNVLLE